MTFGKRQNYGDSKKINGCQGFGGWGRMAKWNRGFLVSVKLRQEGRWHGTTIKRMTLPLRIQQKLVRTIQALDGGRLDFQ